LVNVAELLALFGSFYSRSLPVADVLDLLSL
jgi:hypothetical protein